jgi:superfamily II DNA or RNA helicase
MSCKFSIDNLRQEDKLYIQTSLELGDGECFIVKDDNVRIPFAFAKATFETGTVLNNLNGTSKFTAQLRPEQIAIKDRAKNHITENGAIIIAAHPGFGKTIVAISLACEYNLKTVVIVNKICLLEQWCESIQNFTSSRVQKITPKTRKLDEEATFYVVNAINVSKFSIEFWSSIKFLIVDELHQIVARVLSMSLLWFEPNFVVGLSATPYRFDEYDKAISWFFGKTVIGKELNCKHVAKILNTGFKPSNLKFTRQGVDWNGVLEDQCRDEKRNDIIVENICEYPDKTWMVLVKRVEHAALLVEKFAKKNIPCATLIGSAITFDRQCKILIGTTSKIGVGFDHAAIDALCIAADVKNYFVQFLGRCMRRPDCEPIVLDFNDNYPPLKRHLDERIKEYRARGGTVIHASDGLQRDERKKIKRMLK